MRPNRTTAADSELGEEAADPGAQQVGILRCPSSSGPVSSEPPRKGPQAGVERIANIV